MMESALQHVLGGSRQEAGYPQNLSEITPNNMFLFDLYSAVILDFRPKGNDLYVIIYFCWDTLA